MGKQLTLPSTRTADPLAVGIERFVELEHSEPDDITTIINLLRLRDKVVMPQCKIAAFRNPKDDKFLEAALAVEAECTFSGNADLFPLMPFENIPILRSAEFLASLESLRQWLHIRRNSC